jgi:Skp family chaperone for outer membrane proteins
MKKIAYLAILAAGTVAAPASAQAQAVLVVDTDRILAECTACRAATTTLQGQETQLKQRIQQLEAQLKPEETSLQTAVRGLAGKQPDAALQARIAAYEQKARQAQTEIDSRQKQLQSTLLNVRQQVGSRAAQITEQVRARRQAAVVIAKANVIANNTAVDITGEVLTALNQQLPSVSVTPMPQAQQTKPQGR